MFTIVTRVASACMLVLALPWALAAIQHIPAPEVITTGGPGARIHATPNSNRNGVVFRVRNSGSQTARYELACGVTGALSSCLASDSIVEVEPGTFVRVGVRYTSGGHGSGRVTLTATLKPATGGVVQNSAGYHVLIVAPESSAEMPLKVHGPRADASTDGRAGEEFSLYGVSNPPFMIISPSGGSFTSSQLDVMIEWCSWGYQLLPSTRAIDFNSVNVTTSFSYVNTPFECAQYAGFSLGQVTLVSGTNTLNTVIKSGYGLGYGSAQYSYTPPAAPGAPTVDISPNPGTRLVRSACVTAGSGPAGAFQCGDLLVAHSMPAFRTLNRDRTMTLLYNSATARPYSIVMADVSLGDSVGVPDQIDVRLNVNSVNRATHSFASTGFTSGGSARRLAVGFDPVAAGLGTGVYPFTLYVINVYAAQSDTTVVNGDLIVVDRRASPYGAGWAIAGVERLVTAQRSNAVMLIDGAGSALVYESIGTNVWRAPAGAYRDTMWWGNVSDGSVPTANYYWRRGLDGTRSFYNAAGLQRYVVDRLGNKVEYDYTNAADPNSGLAFTRIAPHNLDLRYNLAYTSGKLSTITDPAGRVLTATINNGQLSSVRDSANDPYSTSFAYDSIQHHRLIKRVSRRGFATAYRYYNNLSFGPTGLLVADSLPIANTSNSSVYRPVQLNGLAKQASGNATALTDTAYITIDGPRAEADITRILVNGDQAAVKIIDPTSAAVHIRYATNAPLLPDSVATANGYVMRMRYDNRARLEWTEVPNFNEGRDSITYVYQGATPDQPSEITVPLNGTNRLTTSFVYNSNGTLEQSTDPRGQVTNYEYNSRGQADSVIVKSVPVYVSNAQPSVTRDVVTRFHYNSLANTDSVKSDEGRFTRLRYDAYGNVIARDNPLQVDSFVYNKLNQPIAAVQRDGITTFTTTMQYDPDGHLIVRTDPRSVQRIWEYDKLGRDTAEVDEFSKRAIRRYDPAGNVIATVTRQGDKTSSIYDAAGRLEKMILDTVRVDNAAEAALYREPVDSILVPGDVLTYEYDVPGTTLVTRAANRNAVIRREYNVEGALITEIDSVNFLNPKRVYTKTYTYNAAGARQLFTTPAGRNISYNFSTQGDLTSIGSPVGSSNFKWHALGDRDSLHLPDGTGTKYRYDGDGLLRQLFAYHPNLSPQYNHKGIVDQTFFYDAAGRPDSMVDRSIIDQGGSGLVTIWLYDGRGQLKSYNTPATSITYAYDASGNRITETSGAGTSTNIVPDSTNRIIARIEPLGTHYYRHDANGAVVSDSTRQPVSIIAPSNWYSRSVRTFYDALGRPTIVKIDSIPYSPSQVPICCSFTPVAFDYHYDALGRARMRETRVGGTPVVPDGHNVVSIGSAIPVEVVNAPGTDDPLMLLPPSGDFICGYSAGYFITHRGRLYDFHRPDGVSCIDPGNSHWETYGRHAGAIVDGYSFGMSRSSGGSNLSFFRNRLYDPRTGRFTQEDPIGFAGGSNLYAYAGNNPAGFTDRFGLCPETGDNLPCIDGYDPIVGRAKRRDPRLDFGQLIDMSVGGIAAGVTANLRSAEFYVVRNSQCFGARATVFNYAVLDGALAASYFVAAGLALRGAALLLEGKAIQSGLILTATVNGPGATGAAHVAAGKTFLRSGAGLAATGAAGVHERISPIPGMNTIRFINGGGLDACN